MPAQLGQAATENGYRFLRRNFILGVINGSLFIFASSLLDPTTVLPAFAVDVGGGVMAVGLMAAAIQAGWAWPPVFLAGIMERAPRLMPFYRGAALFRCACVWGAVWVVAHAHHGHPELVILIASLLFASTSGGGVGLLPFMAVVSATIPPTWRGKFFGLRYLFGGLLSLAGGVAVKRLLSEPYSSTFPRNYVMIFAAAAVAMTVALVIFCFAAEPARRPRRRALPPLGQLRRGGRIFVRDPDYRHLIIARMLLGFAGGFSMPFLAPYAINKLGLPTQSVGAFMVASVLAYSFSNVLWSYLSDGPGNRILLLISGACYLAVPATALVAEYLPAEPAPQILGLPASARFWWMMLVFVLMGLSKAGQMMGYTNYLLEISPESSRPTYLAFYYVTGLPMAFLPVLGAAIIGEAGRYTIGFVAALLLSALMIWFISHLHEVRQRTIAAGGR